MQKTYKGLKAFQKALDSGVLKESNIIDLCGNYLGPGDAKHIADALASGKCRQGLSINLGYNYLGPGDAKHIYNAVAQAIEDKSLPYGVRIHGLSDEVLVMLKSYNDSLRSNVETLSNPEIEHITGLPYELRQITASYIDPGLARNARFFSTPTDSQPQNSNAEESGTTFSIPGL